MEVKWNLYPHQLHNIDTYIMSNRTGTTLNSCRLLQPSGSSLFSIHCLGGWLLSSVDTMSVSVNTKWERRHVKKIVVERLCWNFTLSVAKICRGNKWTRKIGFLSSKKTLAWLWLTRDKLLNFVLKLITALSSATHPHHQSSAWPARAPTVTGAAIIIILNIKLCLNYKDPIKL